MPPEIIGMSGRPKRSLVLRYGMALFFVSVALGVTLCLQHLFPYPFLFLFFGAVMAAAWFGGTAAGLFAVLLSTVVVDYFFVPPLHSFSINATAESYFAAFVACAVVASWVSSSKRKSEEALKEVRNQLEMRVSERTAELQKSNIELQESGRQLRLLTEVIPQQIWSGTPDGSIDHCNERLLKYAGCTMDEMRGEQFMDTIHPEDRASFCQSWQDALSNRTHFEGEWRVRGANGQYRWFVTRSVPLKDAGGKILRWYGTNTDIEERHKAEEALMKTQSELAHLSRVLSMGELTASIAHEISQPLTAVVTHGDACLAWLSASPPNIEKARRTTERIIQDGTRAGAVLGRIRALFKKEPLAEDWVDMNEVIQELTVFLRDEAIRRSISIRAELDPDLPGVRADRVQLQQVVLNLMMNGMDAMTSTNGMKELVISSRKQMPADIMIQVEDCGVGVSTEIAEKIFDPFFTTKPQGIGMGLSISRSIVESYQGRLWTVPRPSGGASFQFTVPVRSKDSDG